MGSAAGQGDPRRQGLAHRIKAAEAGQQRGMNVDQTLGEGADQGARDDAHPARHHHHINAGCLKSPHQGLVEGLAAGHTAVVMHLARYGEALGPLLGTAAGIVDHQQGHLCLELAVCAGLHQGFKVAAGSRSHHPQPQDWLGPGPIRLQFRWQWPLDAGLLIARV